MTYDPTRALLTQRLSVLEGFPVESWLSAQATRLLGSPNRFARAAGVGLVARLWASGSEASDEVWQRLERGDEDPTARARAWARGLSDEVANDLLLVLAGRLASFENILSSVEDAFEGHLELEDAMARLVEERDDMASVQWVLAQTAVAEEARDVIGGFDALAATHHLAVETIRDRDLIDRLYAVAEVEPDQWWVRSLPRE